MEFGNFLVIDQNGYQADMNSAELVQAFAEKHFPD